VEIALEDLRGSFTLKAGDRDLVFSQHGPARLGVAVALGALRFMGFVPDDLASIPEHALLWVCDQLEAEPTELLAYGARAQTRSDDLGAIRAHLAFRIAHTQDLDLLAGWLGARALEHDAPSALFSRAAEHLLARRIVRPSVDQLARMIATAREAATTRYLTCWRGSWMSDAGASSTACWSSTSGLSWRRSCGSVSSRTAGSPSR
jgi:hypothetical protein